MTAKFEVDGIAEVFQRLAELPVLLDNLVYSAIEETVMPRIRAETPVKTGRTRQGWRLRRTGRFQYEIFNTTPYAAFIPRRGDKGKRFGAVAIGLIGKEFPNAVSVAAARFTA